MARTLRNNRIGSPTARAELKPSGKPYFVELEPGVHLGYRKPTKGAGKWVLRTYEGSGVYKVETIGTADDAANARDADGLALLSWKQAQDIAKETIERRVLHAATAEAKAYTVAVAAEEYLSWFEAARKSVTDTKHRIEAHILPILGERPVAELTADEIRKWLHDLAKAPARVRSKGGKPQRFRNTEGVPVDDLKRRRRASANRTLTILKAVLNRAWREKKADSDDAWRRVEPFQSVDTARIRYLSMDEARRLINASDSDFRHLVEAALATGCRYGELCRMTVSDFHPDVGTVAVRTSKSGKPRHVVLTDDGAELFRRLTRGRPGRDLLFVSAARIAWAKDQAAEKSRRTGKAIDVDEDGSWRPSQQARPMAEASKHANITPAINFHALRHTWASHAVMNGVPLLVVAKNLGHADTRMVEKHYGHLAPSYIADAIRAGAPRFGSSETDNIASLGSRG